MWAVYKVGTRIVKGYFPYKHDAIQFHRLHGGDLVRICASESICQYCLPCQCTHNADEHIAGEGACYICECERWIGEIVESN